MKSLKSHGLNYSDKLCYKNRSTFFLVFHYDCIFILFFFGLQMPVIQLCMHGYELFNLLKKKKNSNRKACEAQTIVLKSGLSFWFQPMFICKQKCHIRAALLPFTLCKHLSDQLYLIPSLQCKSGQMNKCMQETKSHLESKITFRIQIS